MAQTTEECLAFLSEARDALDELSLLKDQEAQLGQEEKKLEKTLSTEKKLVSDTIQQTVKSRRAEIDSSYETELAKVQEKLKKERNKREKAKNQRMKDRIEEETSELHSQNQELQMQLKTLFKGSGAPVFCRTRLYYSLFMPHFGREYLTLFGGILLAFLVLPFGAYLLIPERKALYLAVIYALDILVFAGAYILISSKTKVPHLDTLKKGRAILDQIYSNHKKIRVITATIRKDRNESQYNLEKYDDEISQLQQELDTVANQKKEALNTFENVTKTILSDEIEHNHKERLDQLEQDYQQTSARLKETQQQLKTRTLYVAEHYGTYLGKEFLDPLKIVDLSALIRDGKAKNVTEAIAQYQNQKQAPAQP